jgi:hypothetical protein
VGLVSEPIIVWEHEHEDLQHVITDELRNVPIATLLTQGGPCVALLGYALSPAEARDLAASLLIAADYATPDEQGTYGGVR